LAPTFSHFLKNLSPSSNATATAARHGRATSSPEHFSSRSETPTLNSTHSSLQPLYPEFGFDEVRKEIIEIQEKFDKWLLQKKEKILADNLKYSETLRANAGNFPPFVNLWLLSICFD
jgi:hypothetical protein